MEKIKNFKMNISPDFRRKCEEAIKVMSPDQDEIEVPNSGGQFLIRANSPAAKKRKELIKEASCFPFKSEKGDNYLVCAK